MSHHMNITLELTGARAGKTCVLGKYQFVNGRTVVRGDITKVGGAITYLGRVYKAFPLGSAELAAGGGNGKADADTAAGGRFAEPIQGSVHNDGSADQATASGSGTDGGGKPAAEHDPIGYRHPDTRLREAVMKLDPANPEHWTEGGDPQLSAVAKMLGSGNVTRKDVKRVAPDITRKGG